MSAHEQPPLPEPCSPPDRVVEERQTVEIKKSLRSLDRKDSWYWWNAILVIMLLMGAIGALSLPSILHADDPNYNRELSIAVRGLLGLVLIFNLYTLYQQHLLKQLRVPSGTSGTGHRAASTREDFL